MPRGKERANKMGKRRDWGCSCEEDILIMMETYVVVSKESLVQPVPPAFCK